MKRNFCCSTVTLFPMLGISCQDVGMLEIPAELSARLRSGAGQFHKKLNWMIDFFLKCHFMTL